MQNGEFTESLLANQILPSAGHSNILFKDFEMHHKQGIKHLTHLYNGMSGISQRDPGLAAAGLYYDDVLCELITDGIHVDVETIKLTYKIKGYQGICIITDAVNAKGLPDGNYKLGNLNVTKTGIKVFLSDSGTLAGAGATYDHNVRVMLKTISNLKMNELIYMTSINIAKQLGIFEQTGSITVGKKADLVILDKNFEVVKTFVDGDIKFEREKK
ncbi:amidohydrolase family protein [Spiroplasma clarkii]|uniref:amidohydrolase family protein n=1 Tax=Spiroplasma clarkii TaxID=2139 RepID=UPI001F18B675|nr:amidohydrolase family protein [Spiroplasma clarkii]